MNIADINPAEAQAAAAVDVNPVKTVDEQRPGERVVSLPPQVGSMSNDQWESFCKSDVLNFLIKYSLQKITVDDGNGKKAIVKITAKGEYNVSCTTTELM